MSLPPLPTPVHHWRTDVPGRSGPLLSPLFTADQMHAYAAAARLAALEEAAKVAENTATCLLPTGSFLSERVADAIRSLAIHIPPTCIDSGEK